MFRKTVHGMSGLTIPPRLLEAKLPDEAVYEMKEFFAYIMKKYGL